MLYLYIRKDNFPKLCLTVEHFSDLMQGPPSSLG